MFCSEAGSRERLGAGPGLEQGGENAERTEGRRDDSGKRVEGGEGVQRDGTGDNNTVVSAAAEESHCSSQ